MLFPYVNKIPLPKQFFTVELHIEMLLLILTATNEPK